MSIKELNAAFGKQIDTFQGSSEAAAKLNTIFGTTINSYELMLETDPRKRMEMVRKELDHQGKSWDKLNVFEKNVITSTLGVSEEQASLAFSSEKVRRQLEAQAEKKRQAIKDDEKWNAGLGSIKKTLIAWGPLLDQLMRSASNFIVKLFGGDNAADTVENTAKAGENAIRTITQAINEAKEDIDNYKESWDEIFSFRIVARADELLELLNKQNKSLEEQARISELSRQEDIASVAKRKLRLGGASSEQASKIIGEAENKAKFLTGEITPEQYSKIHLQSIPPAVSKIEEPKQKGKLSKERDEITKKHIDALDRHSDMIEKMDFSNQKEVSIVLTNMNGEVIGKGLMKSSLGSSR